MTSRRMRWTGYVTRMGNRRGLVGKTEGNRTLGRPKRRWRDNIKLYLQEVGLGDMDLLIWLRTGTDGGRL